MVFRKIPIDNSVRYIPKSEQSKEKENKPKTINLVHFLVNKTKIFHKITKNLLQILQQEDLENLQNSIHTSIRIIEIRYIIHTIILIII